MRRDVINDQDVTPLLLETSFGRRDRASCSGVVLRTFWRPAMAVWFLRLVDDGYGVVGVN